MRKLLLAAVPLALAATSPALPQASADLAAGRTAPSPLSPNEIVAAAPRADWVAIAPADLLVMDLAPDAKGRPRRVVIQLMPPPFSQGWIGNIRTLAAAHWWDGLSVNRVQDNYVVQWGDADGEDAKKARALPKGLVTVPESEYLVSERATTELSSAVAIAAATQAAMDAVKAADRAESSGSDRFIMVESQTDFYARLTMHFGGWPIAMNYDREGVWPVHCYGMVGVGRDLSPNTGSGAELYVVIGHAPRHLDRNIALVGRVIAGIEHLSSLPRGTGGLGFYETPEERTGIVSIRLGREVVGLPAYEYLSTESESFARYADARANRRDPFFIRPAGGADICNIPVPVRRVK
jgi:cyclophilin family peptidyl-prolyl cis-trans isomerase